MGANTNSGGKLYIAVNSGTQQAEAQNTDLTQVGYEALTWLQVKSVGNVGETGSNTNILSYDTWDTTVTQKAAGITNAGDPEIEVARIPTDAGQVELRRAALPANRVNNYAFKVLHLDGTVKYNRGLVLGPRHPNGRNEDFVLEIFALALNQEQIIVNP